jgi:hypothetical protein
MITNRLGINMNGDFSETLPTKAQLDDMTTLFIEWVAPALNAGRMENVQRAVYETIYRDLGHQLAAGYSDLRVKVRLPEHNSPENAAHLQQDIGDAMMELYFRLSRVAVIAVRRALIAASETI